jgi:hypothetical protein
MPGRRVEFLGDLVGAPRQGAGPADLQGPRPDAAKEPSHLRRAGDCHIGINKAPVLDLEFPWGRLEFTGQGLGQPKPNRSQSRHPMILVLPRGIRYELSNLVEPSRIHSFILFFR